MTRLAFQAWDDFDTYTIASAITGYTLRGGGAPTFKPQYSTAAILPYKRRYAEFLTDATTDYHAFSRDLVDGDANRATFDIVDGFAMDLMTTEDWTIYARGQGTATMTDFLRARVVKASGVIAIDKMVASAYTAGSGASTTTITLTAGHAYLVRFRGVAGAVSLKVWDAALGMAGEPTAFNLTPTGMTPTAAGWIAYGGRHSTLTGKVAAFNFDATATNGDTAICPRTNTEYTAFLASQTATRACLAKMRFTGYDSSGSPYTATRKVYLSNHGYTSQSQDSPAQQHFDNYIIGVPSFSREMPAALSGQAVVNLGRLRVSNPASPADLRQNLITYSEQANNAAWTKSNLTVSADAIAAYDGVVRADQLIENTAVNVFHDLVQSGGTLTQGRSYTLSAKIKASGRTKGVLGFYDNTPFGGVYPGVDFDLTAVTASATGGATKCAIQDLGSGWYLVTCTGTCTVTTAAVPMFIRPKNGAGTSQYTGDGASGLYVDQMHYRNALASPLYITTTTPAIDQYTNASAGGVPGIRDDWARIHWLRDGFELLLGDPAWPLHDFRHLVRGRLGNPTCPELGVLEFPIADMSEALNAPVQTKFTSGDYNGQYKPALIGYSDAAFMEPPLTSASTLTYTMADAAVTGTGGNTTAPWFTVRDNGIPVATLDVFDFTFPTVSAVDTGTETITSVGHGALVGATVQFQTGTPPAPLALATDYYVIAAGWTADTFRLSATSGGAAINLTSATTGAGFVAWNFTVNAAAATFTLLANPAGRITCGNTEDADTGTWKLDGMYADIAFTRLGLSLNHKDAASFTALGATATSNSYYGWLWLDPTLHLGRDVLAQLAAGSTTWYGFAPDGVLQVGMISLPATAAKSFTAGDVKAGSLRLVDTVRAVNFEGGTFSYLPAYLMGGGEIPSSIPFYRQGGQFLTAYSYGAAGVPLDDHPDEWDANEVRSVGTIITSTTGATALRAHLVDLYKHTLGIFEFDTTLPASELSIGDTISLDFPRLGWKQYTSADPASPDNTATIDATKAVVIGINVNLDAPDAFKTRIKCFRRIPGYYPTANLN